MPGTEVDHRHGRKRLEIRWRRRAALVLLLAEMVLRRVRGMRAVIPFPVLPWAGLVTRHTRMSMSMRMSMRMMVRMMVRVTAMSAVHGLDRRCPAAIDMIFEGQV